jgi:integrase
MPIQLRPNGYYFRQRVPDELREVLGGKREIVRALRTSDPAEAQRRAAGVEHEVAVLFASKRQAAQAARRCANATLQAARPRGTGDRSSERSLGSLVDAYLADRTPHWSTNHRVVTSCSLELASEHFGRDRALASLTRDDIRGYRQALLARPGRAGRPATAATVNAHVGQLSTMLRWAMLLDWLDRNPCEGMRIKDSRGLRRSELRSAFTDEQIVRVFETWKPTSLGMRWVPLLMAYQGMRVEEAAQLRFEDVVAERGHGGLLLGLRIQARPELGTSVKNASSERTVPLHPKLVKAFTSEVRSGGKAGWLFEDLVPMGLQQKRGRAVGIAFCAHLRALGFDASYVLYSLRHTVITKLAEAEVPEHLIADLVGHENKSQTAGRYRKTASASRLFDALQKLNYSKSLVN